MNDDGRHFPKRRVITTDVSLGPFAAQVAAIAELGAARRSSYVCCVNVHMAMECRDPAFARVVNEANLATADGMPIVYGLRALHGVRQERVAGNDLMPALLGEAERRGLSVYLYGGTEGTQRRIVERAARELPGLRFAGTHAPPFAPMEGMDLEADAQRINASGAHLVMVSLGCPKQERWMAAMKGRVDAVMAGLGGAFLLYAGVDTRAPRWMRTLSLEWLYRLCLEPKRLWRRYLLTNTTFVALFMRELLRKALGGGRSGAGEG